MLHCVAGEQDIRQLLGITFGAVIVIACYCDVPHDFNCGKEISPGAGVIQVLEA